MKPLAQTSFGGLLALLLLAAAAGAGDRSGEVAYTGAISEACSKKPFRTLWQGSAELYSRLASGAFGSRRFNDEAGLDGATCARDVSGQEAPGGYRISIPEGCIATGLYAREDLEKHDRAVLEYTVCFSDGYDFRGGKLPSLGGGRGSGGAGAGGSCSGFSAGIMFGRADGIDRNRGGRGGSYTYWCEQPGQYGGCGRECSWADGAPLFWAGSCHRISQQVVMNTPGQRDGIIRVWVDGRLVNEKADYLFRPHDENFGIDFVRFNFFYGGGSASWATNTDVHAAFKDFRILSDPPFCR